MKRMCTLHQELGEEEDKNGGKFSSSGQFSAAAGMQEWDLKVSEEVKCKFYQI